MCVCCIQACRGRKASKFPVVFFRGGEVFFLRGFSTLVVFLRLQHYLFNKPFQFDSNKCLRVSFVASKKLIFPPLLLLLKDVFIFSSSYSFRKTAVVAVTVAVGEGQRYGGSRPVLAFFCLHAFCVICCHSYYPERYSFEFRPLQTFDAMSIYFPCWHKLLMKNMSPNSSWRTGKK